MAKKECEYSKCKNKFEASGKKKFCSDKCKVAAGREKDKPSDVPEGVGTKSKAISQKHQRLAISPDKYEEARIKDAPQEKSQEWVKKIELFCEQQGITPDDLIEAYKNRNKKAPVNNKSMREVLTMDSGKAEAISDYVTRRRNMKISGKKEG